MFNMLTSSSGSEGSTDTDKATAHFFDLCADAGQANCALAVQDQSGDQLKETYVNFLNDLKNGVVTAKDPNGQSIDAFGIKSKFFKVLYNPELFKNFASELDQIYGTKAASTPDKQQKSRLVRRFVPGQAGEVNSTQSTAAISGSDFFRTGTATVERFRQLLSTYNAKSFFAGEVAVSNQQGIETWQVTAKERFSGSFSNIATKNPILFVNTIYDPVCPLISAQRSSAGFSLSKVKIHNGAGHCSNVNPSETLNKEIAEYLTTGDLPDTSTATNPDQTNPFKPAQARQKRSAEDLRYTQAVQNLAKINMDNVGSVSRPAALEVAKRDVFELLVRQEQAIPSGCVPIQSSAASSAGPSASSTSIPTSQTSTLRSSGLASASQSSAPSTTASQTIVSSSFSASLVSPSSAMSSTTGGSTVVSGITTDLSSASISVASGSSTTSDVIGNTVTHDTTLPVSTISAWTVTHSSVASALSSGSSSVTSSGTPSGPLSSVSVASTSAFSSSGTQSASSGIVSVDQSTRSGTQTSLASVVTLSSSSSSQTSGVTVNGTTNTVPVASPSGTSSVIVNGTAFTLEADTAYSGYSLSGASIAKRAATSLDACLSSCAQNIACVGAAYGTTQGSCTIYGSIIIASKRSAQGVTFATVASRRAVSGGPSIVVGNSTSVVSITGGVSSQTSNALTTPLALPSTTIWVTSVVNVCPTGLSTSPITFTATCPGGCSTRPTTIPQGYTTVVVYCSACAIPSSVVVTTPIASVTGSNGGNQAKTVTAYTGPKSSLVAGPCTAGSCSDGSGSNTGITGNTGNTGDTGNTGNTGNTDSSKTIFQTVTAQTASIAVGGNNNAGGSQAIQTPGISSNVSKNGLLTTTTMLGAIASNSTMKPTMAVYTGLADKLSILGPSFVICFIAFSIML